ncbi:DUF4439 domain-containing protein [Actinotalea solisilvae]|uniref:DUF4439 domain-containing protein n=1 Tax=Actinotalea solisilvae TaxID=2072922 RepID=UPI0018F21BFD|nr:DUF4439 domain-containing protein [Actinotalea solisilvae]
MRPRPAPPHPARRPASVLVALLGLAVLLAGCGLRLETPAPQAPEPDAVETVRQRATADALALQVLADSLAASGAEAGLAAAAGTVAAASTAHLDALGGLYVAFPDATAAPDASDASDATVDPDPAASPGPTATTVPSPVTPDALVALLDSSAASARADAAAVEDGDLARLLASVTVARTQLADSVAALAALDPASRPALEPAPLAGLPAGVDPADVADVVQSEDALGFAWEVVAARRVGDERSAAAARARSHREHAETWAVAAEVAATDSDPRRVAYALPPTVLDAAADPAATAAELAALEVSLVASYAGLVAQADAGERTPLVDAMLTAARSATALTGQTPAFPGLPEHAG